MIKDVLRWSSPKETCTRPSDAKACACEYDSAAAGAAEAGGWRRALSSPGAGPAAGARAGRCFFAASVKVLPRASAGSRCPQVPGGARCEPPEVRGPSVPAEIDLLQWTRSIRSMYVVAV
ncbi:unnamed protein product [Prorocentrum cordatum]|uniref:Uncharacterized protein n=1 Tax=Prorocentrum cordatum TaxID=2364126 RepID=A0ABN9T3T7_9DINO|nr:unnamed protein product [Polarella glacialis]